MAGLKERLPLRKKLSRRDFLKIAGITTVAAGVKFLPDSKHKEQEIKPLLKVTEFPTIGHDVGHDATLIPRPRRTKTQDVRIRSKTSEATETPTVVVETLERQPTPESTRQAEILLTPEMFSGYHAFGSEGDNGSLIDYLPNSYKRGERAALGLWNRAVESFLLSETEILDKPLNLKVNIKNPDEGGICFNLFPVLEGASFFDLQEQDERVLPCRSRAIVIGGLAQDENQLIVLYQEPVNECFYFARVKKSDWEQKGGPIGKNTLSQELLDQVNQLTEIGTPKQRTRFYTVEDGDNLSRIAKKFGLPSWHSVYGYKGNIKILDDNPTLLSPGDKLEIPNRRKEKDLIEFLTPDMGKLSLGKEFLEDPNGRYFKETNHYVKGPFLEFFEKWGLDVLGYPISEEEKTEGGGKWQYFQRAVLFCNEKDPESFFYILPVGWSLYSRQVLSSQPNSGNRASQINQPQLASEFKEFYDQHGGREILDSPLSPPYWEGGVFKQWTANARLEFYPQNNQVQLGLLGEEHVQAFMSDFKDQLPCFRPVVKEITVDEALSTIEKQTPEKIPDLEARTARVLVFNITGRKPLTKDKTEFRDNLIFELLAPGQELNFVNIYAILAWHEARFEMNPVVDKVLTQMKDGSRLINRIIQEKVPASLFKEEKYPLLPEDLHGRFVFASGKKECDLGGGGGYRWYPLLYGRYDLYRGLGPDDEELVRKGLVTSGFHELIHSLIQPESAVPHSSWDHQAQKRLNKNLVAPQNREHLLAHMAMCALTAAVEAFYGIRPDIDPRVIRIYQVLKEGWVEEPYAEIVRAGVTFNGSRLWRLYERAKKENDPGLDELLSTKKPQMRLLYYPIIEDLDQFYEEFRREYLVNLR